MHRFIGAFAVLVGLAVLAGCSDTGKPPAPLPETPRGRIIYPPADETKPIADSTEVYAGVSPGAGGGGSVSAVRFLFSRRNKLQPDTIGLASGPVDTTLVPSAVKPYLGLLPDGWSLYKHWWFTGPQHPPNPTYVASGEHVQLFALVTDESGTQGRSDILQVRVLNMGDSLRPPTPCFTADPPQGKINEIITLDPTCTRDTLDADDQVSVRWDFDGDPSNGWDIDWDKGYHADTKVTTTFRLPRTYNIALEAHNSYLPEAIAHFYRGVPITTGRGHPHPPDSVNYVTVPVGSYAMGDTTYVLDDTTRTADTNERPIHQVQFPREYRISKYEVTNALYLGYLREALEAVPPAIEVSGQEVRYKNVDGIADTTWIFLRLDSQVTKIYFDLDSDVFRVQAGYENHPVTGVTWRGADAFCAFYGMRLPTEAEWEIAARGTHEDWAYPFGQQLHREDGCRRATYRDCRTASPPFDKNTTPVGFFNGQVYDGFQTIDSPSPFGCYDMSGNVAEWTADWFGRYKSGQETDPQGPSSGTLKVVRGGSYDQTRESIRSTTRGGEDQLERGFATIGFRPAYSVFLP